MYVFLFVVFICAQTSTEEVSFALFAIGRQHVCFRRIVHNGIPLLVDFMSELCRRFTLKSVKTYGKLSDRTTQSVSTSSTLNYAFIFGTGIINK